MDVIPEISPPVGYFRVDQACKRWLEIRYGHEALNHTPDDELTNEFVLGVKARKGLLFLVDSNGERQDVDPDEWKSDVFLSRELETQEQRPSERPILCISQNEIELWARQELREWLFDELKYDRLDLDKARDIWAKAGTGNLEGNPDPASFDPMNEVFWTLPMAVAWIAWGDPQRVVEHWDKYREKCGHFDFKVWRCPGGPEHEGWIFYSDELANLDWMISAHGAKQKLFRALQGDEVKASGLNSHGKRLPIDALLWQDHGTTLEAWKKITVPRESVVRLFDYALPTLAEKKLKRKSVSRAKMDSAFEKYKASIPDGKTTTRNDTRAWAKETFGGLMPVSEADEYDLKLAACQNRKPGPSR